MNYKQGAESGVLSRPCREGAAGALGACRSASQAGGEWRSCPPGRPSPEPGCLLASSCQGGCWGTLFGTSPLGALCSWRGPPPPPASLPPSQPQHLSLPCPGPRPCLLGTSLYSATSQVALGCLSRMCPGAAKKPSRSPSPPGSSPSRAPSAAKPQLSGPRSLALPGTLLWVPDFLPCSSHSPVGRGEVGSPLAQPLPGPPSRGSRSAPPSQSSRLPRLGS